MKKNVNTENTESNASTPSNGRRTKKRGRKAASSKKAQTRAKASPNTSTMKLVAQATKAIARANAALGKIKF